MTNHDEFTRLRAELEQVKRERDAQQTARNNLFLDAQELWFSCLEMKDRLRQAEHVIELATSHKHTDPLCAFCGNIKAYREKCPHGAAPKDCCDPGGK